jgi:nucleoprotein TPR
LNLKKKSSGLPYLSVTLKLAEADLANARGNVQQFKEISQANETALEDLNATYDQYKTKTDAQIAQLEVRGSDVAVKILLFNVRAVQPCGS